MCSQFRIIVITKTIGKCALDANKLKDAPNGTPCMQGVRLSVVGKGILDNTWGN